MFYLCFRLYKFNKASQSKDLSMTRKNIGRPTSIPDELSLQTETACSTKSLRSSTEPYIKVLCTICQKRKASEDTDIVKTKRKDLRMLQRQQRLKLKVFSYGSTQYQTLKTPLLMTLFIASHIGFTNSTKPLKVT